MQLKAFQHRALKTLGDFLAALRVNHDLQQAFAAHAPSFRGAPARYLPVPSLEAVPYVCLRVPTGGGKTILAAHAISVIQKNYVDRDRPFVLWMVPTDTIRSQTAAALKNRRHPYREALEDVFAGQIEVLDADELDRLRPQDLASKVCIVVATVQTFRVEDRSIRDVYAEKEDYAAFFAGVSPDGLQQQPGTGRPVYSFENLMRLCAPIILVDEAHNVRTPRSFETLARLGPSCILELTATPETRSGRDRTPSNVLVNVHTGELKTAEMVKLPILLSVHPEGWKQALSSALTQQRGLLELARGGETEYVRPLLLVQAQNTNGEANVEAVKTFLLEEGVAESAIKIATGEQRELDGVDLFDPAVQVDVVITMEALREGWDCSFAYVFCSLRNVTGATAVEQLLGRVLRMPYARRREVPELNLAYAHVVSQDFAATAAALKDRLVEKLGFTPEESQDFLVQAPHLGPGLFAKTIDVERRPNLSGIPEEETEAVRLLQSLDGRWSVELREEIVPELASRILAVVPEPALPEARARIAVHNREVQAAQAAFTPRAFFSVPQLYVEVGNQPFLFTPEFAGEETPLRLADFDLNLEAFSYSPADQRFAIDFRSGQMEVRPLQRNASFSFAAPREQTALELVRWLNAELHTTALTYGELAALLTSVITRLQAERAVPLPKLWEAKFALARWLADGIEATQGSVHACGYQQMLAETYVPPSDEFAFHFRPGRYYPEPLYRGSLSFSKHLYLQIGEMNGPEVECARALDAMEQVEVWVRNVDSDQQNSFKLPRVSQYFYPDFVAKLTDGRVMVIEYKGELRVYEDAEEKLALGRLWQDRGNGRGIFAWIESHAKTGRSIEQQLQVAIKAAAAETRQGLHSPASTSVEW